VTDRQAALLDLLTTAEAWQAAAFPNKSVTPRPWSVYETYFYMTLRRILEAEAARLAAHIMGSGPDGATGAAWYLAHQGELLDALTNSLEDVVRYGVLAGRQALGNPAISTSWELVNSRAVDWAAENAAQLVKGITETTRKEVAQAVSEWCASGQPLSKLAQQIESLDSAFGPARARLIAQTESTNAFAQGNVRAWTAAGVQLAAYTPAAHPGCRCYLQPWRTPDGQTVMVWYTAHDERVCTQPLDTPWGTVAGCRDLHMTIVSQGDLMGTKKP